MNTLSHAIWLISVPFICLYMSYAFFLVWLPMYRLRVELPVHARLERALDQRDLYFVFVLPCLNEGRVIGNTLRSLLEIPYRHLVVVVIDDGSDDNTVDVVRSINDKRVRLHQRKFPNARQGKGEALNSCYSRINRAVTKIGINPDQVIIAVFDGDGRPSADFIWEAVETFANKQVGAAQSRVRIMNHQRLLPLMQDLEFAVTVGAIQNSREYLGSVGLGGNGQLTRLSALRSLGEKPWTRCLTEDFDLGVRILLNNWKIRDSSESYVAQQGLASVRRFIRQRTRWVQGNMQCLRYFKTILWSALPKTAKLDLLYFLLQPWISVIGSIIQVGAFCAMLVTLTTDSSGLFNHQHLLYWIVQLIWLMALVFGPGFLWISTYQRRIQRISFGQCLRAGLFYPIYNLLVIPCVWRAFWRQLSRQDSWAKTDRLHEPIQHRTLEHSVQS